MRLPPALRHGSRRKLQDGVPAEQHAGGCSVPVVLGENRAISCTAFVLVRISDGATRSQEIVAAWQVITSAKPD